MIIMHIHDLVRLYIYMYMTTCTCTCMYCTLINCTLLIVHVHVHECYNVLLKCFNEPFPSISR